MFLRLCFYVMVFSFLGWILEVAFQAVKHHRFINRGFCYGPVCPIYGCGVALVYFCLSGLRQTWIPLFLASVALTSGVELLTGFVMDKCFETRWWDYGKCRFNLGGYICLRFSLIWGALCMGVVKWLFPAFDFLFALLPQPLVIVLAVIFFEILAVDTSLSAVAAAGVKNRLKLLDSLAEQLRFGSDSIGNRVYSGTVKLEETYNILQEKTVRLAARFLKAFPDMKSGKHGEQLDRIRVRFNELRDRTAALVQNAGDLLKNPKNNRK